MNSDPLQTRIGFASEQGKRETNDDFVAAHEAEILAYAGSEKAAEDVGFYYADDPLGRFFGTLMSGLLYQWGGLLYALMGSALMLFTCWLLTLALPTRLSRKPKPCVSAFQTSTFQSW